MPTTIIPKALFIFLVFSTTCLAQNNKIVLVNKDKNWNKTPFSYYYSWGNIPVSLREMIAHHQLDTGKYANEITTDKPLLFNFSYNYKIQMVYLFPGDTLEFRLTEDNTLPYLFTGNRPSEELMFLSKLEASDLGYIEKGNHNIEVTEKLNFQYIAEQTFERYTNRQQYLKRISKSVKFTERGKRVILNALYYRYLAELLFPYSSLERIGLNNSLVPAFYKNKLRGLVSELNNDSLSYLYEYRVAFLNSYAKFLMAESGSNEFTFPSLLSFYKEYFNGHKRDILLYNEIRFYCLTKGIFPNITDWTGSFENTAMRDTLLSLYDKSKKDLPKMFLQTQLKSITGENCTLEALKLKYPQKLIYLDFWATWCKPCLMEMPESAKLGQEFKNDAIAFVYISLDEDHLKWLTRVSQLPLGYDVDHYRMSDQSLYAAEMGSVPRYVLIGKNGQIISYNAPRPSSTEIRELLYKNIKP